MKMDLTTVHRYILRLYEQRYLDMLLLISVLNVMMIILLI